MRINFKNSSYTFSFKSKKQLALFMLIKEYYIENQMDYAEILFQIKGRECREKLKNLQNVKNKFWNNIFDMERIVNGKRIIVGAQDFNDGTILIKDSRNHVFCCPMFQDKEGNIYFTYENKGVYISEYTGEFEMC